MKRVSLLAAILAIFFVVGTSFSVDDPCPNQQLYEDPSFNKPIFGVYGVDWHCDDQIPVTCAYYYDVLLEEFIACGKGQYKDGPPN